MLPAYNENNHSFCNTWVIPIYSPQLYWNQSGIYFCSYFSLDTLNLKYSLNLKFELLEFSVYGKQSMCSCHSFMSNGFKTVESLYWAYPRRNIKRHQENHNTCMAPLIGYCYLKKTGNMNGKLMHIAQDNYFFCFFYNTWIMPCFFQPFKMFCWFNCIWLYNIESPIFGGVVFAC